MLSLASNLWNTGEKGKKLPASRTTCEMDSCLGVTAGTQIRKWKSYIRGERGTPWSPTRGKRKIIKIDGMRASVAQHLVKLMRSFQYRATLG